MMARAGVRLCAAWKALEAGLELDCVMDGEAR